jgi:hypothetical protein
MCDSIQETNFLAMLTLIRIKNDIIRKKYDPYTNPDFRAKYCVLGSGEQLSRNVTILLSKDKNILYLCHPEHILDNASNFATVSVFFENDILKIKQLQKNTEKYSEIFSLYNFIIEEYKAIVKDQGFP